MILKKTEIEYYLDFFKKNDIYLNEERFAYINEIFNKIKLEEAIKQEYFKKTFQHKTEYIDFFLKHKIPNSAKRKECFQNEIENVCQIYPDSDKNIKSEYSFISYLNIDSCYNGILKENPKVLKNKYPFYAKLIIKKNDILFCNIKPYLYSFYFVKKEIPNGIGSFNFLQFRVKNVKKNNPKYIYYMLIYRTFEHVFKNNEDNEGKDFLKPLIYYYDRYKLLIDIIPYNYQIELVKKLEEFDKKELNFFKNVELKRNELEEILFLFLETIKNRFLKTNKKSLSDFDLNIQNEKEENDSSYLTILSLFEN